MSPSGAAQLLEPLELRNRIENLFFPRKGKEDEMFSFSMEEEEEVRALSRWVKFQGRCWGGLFVPWVAAARAGAVLGCCQVSLRVGWKGL